MRRTILFVCFCIIGLSCFAIALPVGMDAYSAWKLNERAKHWPTADAKIIKLYQEKERRYVRHGRYGGGFEIITHFRCNYEYKVSGKVYTSNHITVNRSSSHALTKLKTGDVITIHYNPKDPLQVVASTKGFSIFGDVITVTGLLIVTSLMIGLACQKVDPIEDFARSRDKLRADLASTSVKPHSTDDVNREIGSTIKQMVLVVVFFLMLATGLSMWKTDKRTQNWKTAEATVIRNSSKDEHEKKTLKIQLGSTDGIVIRKIKIAGAEDWKVNKLYPLGSKIMVQYDPNKKNAVVLDESPIASALNKHGYKILGIGSLFFIFLILADPRMFSLGMGKTFKRFTEPKTEL